MLVAEDYENLAAVAIAGLAGEIVLYGPAGASSGASNDQTEATRWLVRARQATLPYDPDVFEHGQASDRGSERMRSAFHAAVQEDSERLLSE